MWNRTEPTPPADVHMVTFVLSPLPTPEHRGCRLQQQLLVPFAVVEAAVAVVVADVYGVQTPENCGPRTAVAVRQSTRGACSRGELLCLEFHQHARRLTTFLSFGFIQVHSSIQLHIYISEVVSQERRVSHYSSCLHDTYRY